MFLCLFVLFYVFQILEGSENIETNGKLTYVDTTDRKWMRQHVLARLGWSAPPLALHLSASSEAPRKNLGGPSEAPRKHPLKAPSEAPAEVPRTPLGGHSEAPFQRPLWRVVFNGEIVRGARIFLWSP